MTQSEPEVVRLWRPTPTVKPDCRLEAAGNSQICSESCGRSYPIVNDIWSCQHIMAKLALWGPGARASELKLCARNRDGSGLKTAVNAAATRRLLSLGRMGAEVYFSFGIAFCF